MKAKNLLMTAITIFGILPTNIAQIPSYVPTNGLVGYWPFNGNANDASGNGYNGTVNGATLTIDRFGNANTAYSFNGINNFIEVLDALPLRLADTDFTISVWFQYSSSLNNQSLLSKRTDQFQNGWTLGIAGGTLPQDSAGFVVHQVSGGADPKIWSQGVIPTNSWQQVLVVYSLATQTIKFYHNNVLGNTETNFPSPNSNTNANLLIGNNNIQPYFMLGQIDDIGIWNRALTEEEITSLYSGSPLDINEDLQSNLFSVFPNPAQNVINVNIDAKLLGSVFTIYDNIGKAVKTGKLNSVNTTIELNDLSSGIYTFSVGENKKQTFKVVKE